MSQLILPSRVDIHVVTWSLDTPSPADVSYSGSPIAFLIHTFARSKNDYRLGPFFTDHNGSLTVSGETLDASVRSHWDWGMMDYSDVAQAFSFIEIYHVPADEVDRAIQFRTTSELSDNEEKIWGNKEQLLAKYRGCANRHMKPCHAGATQRIRDVWDGRIDQYEYTYRVHPSTQTA